MKKILFALAALTVSTLSAAPAGMEPDDHTVAFWDFSMQKQGQIEDQSGFGNTAALQSMENAPLPKILPEEGAVFDGKGGYVQIQVKDSLKIRKGDFSIEVVFKCASEELLKRPSGFFLIGNKSHTEKISGFLLGYSPWQGRKFCFQYALDGKARSFNAPLKKTLETGKWYLLRISRKGDKLSCLLDNQLLAEEKVQGEISLVNMRAARIGIYPAPWQRDKQNRLIVNGFEGTLRFIRFSDIGRDGK